MVDQNSHELSIFSKLNTELDTVFPPKGEIQIQANIVDGLCVPSKCPTLRAARLLRREGGFSLSEAMQICNNFNGLNSVSVGAGKAMVECTTGRQTQNSFCGAIVLTESKLNP